MESISAQTVGKINTRRGFTQTHSKQNFVQPAAATTTAVATTTTTTAVTAVTTRATDIYNVSTFTNPDSDLYNENYKKDVTRLNCQYWSLRDITM